MWGVCSYYLVPADLATRITHYIVHASPHAQQHSISPPTKHASPHLHNHHHTNGPKVRE